LPVFVIGRGTGDFSHTSCGELLPAAKRIAILVNIENADAARLMITDTQEAAFSMGLQTEIVFASNEGEIEPALSARRSVASAHHSTGRDVPE
jgi:hypothetical protein